MTRIMVAPGRYVQGPGVLTEMGSHVRHLGSRMFIVGDLLAWSIVKDAVVKSLVDNGIEYGYGEFSGWCTKAAAALLSEQARTFGADIVAGVGGGSAIDTGKAVAHELNCALVVVPTVASNDAPCSALSVQYGDDGHLEGFLMLTRNPDVVLVDSKVIATSPTRLFVAGMGDALATWFEASACTRAAARNVHGGLSTAAALRLARLCYETLMEYGPSAKLAVDRKALTPAVERVIEANILLSGLGFESAGVAAAHGIQDGMHTLPETSGMLHGELVAFGTLAQLVMENQPMTEIHKVIGFCNTVGLPVTLRQVGVTDRSPENLMKAAEAACMEGVPTHNCPFEVNAEMVFGAIIGADALGEESLKGMGNTQIESNSRRQHG